MNLKYHHSTTTILENITTLLLSVLMSDIGKYHDFVAVCINE